MRLLTSFSVHPDSVIAARLHLPRNMQAMQVVRPGVRRQTTGSEPKQQAAPDHYALVRTRSSSSACARPLPTTARWTGRSAPWARVEPDETRLAFVNTKIAGWVKKLYVNYTGRAGRERPAAPVDLQPRPGDGPGRISPGAAVARSTWHDRRYAGESRRRAATLLESAKRRLLLWDITDQQIAELEKTGKPQTDMIIRRR